MRIHIPWLRSLAYVPQLGWLRLGERELDAFLVAYVTCRDAVSSGSES
jgi:hypothetical protein